MAEKIQTVSELAARVASDPTLQDQIKRDPAGTLAGLAAPLQNDVWIYRMLVGALGLGVLLALLGAVVLSMNNKTVPDILTAIGSASVGALAGLLAPSPVNR